LVTAQSGHGEGQEGLI